MKIPPITIIFRFIKPTEGEKDKPVTTRAEADSSNLVLTLNIEGKIPAGPFSHLSTRPWQVGTVNGTPVFLSYRIERPSDKESQAEIFYSIFKRRLGLAPAQPAIGQAKS